MSQMAERREQGENTDEGKSASEKDCDDQALEAQSCTHSSSCADLTEPRSGVLSEDMQDIKKDIVNIKEINDEQQKRISELEEKLNELSKTQQKRISDLEEKVNELSKTQHKIISELEEKVNELSKTQHKIISELEEKVNETEHNLWLYGLQEQEGEDLKKRVIAICSAVVPEAADDFTRHIDIVQRVGKKNDGKNRPVVIKFTERSTKELLLKTSKSSEFHRCSSLKFAVDLTAKDKETRNRLWPLIDAARKEGKTAYFAGAKVVIDGKEISE